MAKKPGKAKREAKAKDEKVLEKGHAAGQLEGLYRAATETPGAQKNGKAQTPKG